MSSDEERMFNFDRPSTNQVLNRIDEQSIEESASNLDQDREDDMSVFRPLRRTQRRGNTRAQFVRGNQHDAIAIDDQIESAY